MTNFTLYGDSRSGNCLKVAWSADYLGVPCQWVETNITEGQSRTSEFLALNKFGQVPTAVFDKGRDQFVLSQSNAIVLYLCELAGHTTFLPMDTKQRAEVYAWLFWEQNSHEPYIAGRRYRKSILGYSDDQIDHEWLPRGNAALERMNAVLAKQEFLVGRSFTAADVVLFAYTRVADEGGFVLTDYKAVSTWIDRITKLLAINPDTEKNNVSV